MCLQWYSYIYVTSMNTYNSCLQHEVTAGFCAHPLSFTVGGSRVGSGEVLVRAYDSGLNYILATDHRIRLYSNSEEEILLIHCISLYIAVLQTYQDTCHNLKPAFLKPHSLTFSSFLLFSKTFIWMPDICTINNLYYILDQ